MKRIRGRKLHIKTTIEPEVIQNNYQQKKSPEQEISIPVLIVLVIISSLLSGCLGAYFMISTYTTNTTTTSGGITKSTAILTETNSISKAVEKVYDAVVVVEVYDKKNNLISTGTGFVYKKDNQKA